MPLVPWYTGYCFPYIVSVGSKSAVVEVHDVHSGAIAQTLPVEGAAVVDVEDCGGSSAATAPGSNRVRVRQGVTAAGVLPAGHPWGTLPLPVACVDRVWLVCSLCRVFWVGGWVGGWGQVMVLVNNPPRVLVLSPRPLEAQVRHAHLVVCVCHNNGVPHRRAAPPPPPFRITL